MTNGPLRPGDTYANEDLHTSYLTPARDGVDSGSARNERALVEDPIGAVNTGEFQHHRTAPIAPVAAFHPYEQIAFIERR
jgi:hypothetical protein